MTVKQELEKIRKKHRGILRPRDVVDFARNEDTALHKRFEWDDSRAAEQYRLVQAREIIRFTVEVYDENPEPIHCYVSFSDERRKGDSYRLLTEVMSDADHRQKLLDQAEREMDAWIQRYRQFSEFRPVFKAMESVKAKRKTKKRRRG